MEKLRRLIETLIAEGVMEREVTQISRRVIEQLKLQLSKSAGFTRAFKFKVSVPDTIESKPIEVTVKRGQAQNEPIVSGAFKGDPESLDANEISVTIEVPKAWNDFNVALSQMSGVVSELKDILRHEIEHSRQPTEDMIRVKQHELDTLEGVIKYFLDPAEISAHVSGMYKNAKSRRVDLGDILHSRQGDVIRFAKRAGANEDEAQAIAQKVLDAWMAFAMKQFPSARL